MDIRGLLIDMDGLLLDTEAISHAAWNHALDQTGYQLPDDFLISIIGQSMTRIVSLLEETLECKDKARIYINSANRVYSDHLESKEIPVKKGALELLQYLQKQKIPACLATSTATQLAELKLERTGLAEYFTDTVCGDQVSESKPHPAIYLEAASRLGFEPEKCLALEDSNNGCLSALAAGCRVIQVPDLVTPDPTIQKRLFSTFKDLESLQQIIEHENWFNTVSE